MRLTAAMVGSHTSLLMWKPRTAVVKENKYIFNRCYHVIITGVFIFRGSNENGLNLSKLLVKLSNMLDASKLILSHFITIIVLRYTVIIILFIIFWPSLLLFWELKVIWKMKYKWSENMSDQQFYGILAKASLLVCIIWVILKF